VFRQSKVEDLHLVLVGNENVGGFDVAMDAALGVGCSERVGNLNRQLHHSCSIERFLRDALLLRVLDSRIQTYSHPDSKFTFINPICFGFRT
jgi:hypothetical protein